MDLGSRNKTFRKKVTLKPNIYYELTDGVELTFANLTCHYLIPDQEGDEEETQDYGGGVEAAKDEAEEDSDGSTVCDPSEAREGSGEDPLPSRIQAYYMKRDMFISHTRGDFITSPEISQDEAASDDEQPIPKEEASKRGRGGRKQTSRSKTKTSVVESHDLLEESPNLTVSTSPNGKALDDQSDSISEQSSKESTSSQSGHGRRGRGRAKKEAMRTPSVRRTPTSSRKASASATETPQVMFTGVIDKDGQRRVQDLGGEMVDSVYQCTHLITDKVHRTVKLLCCLSRGCLIVSSNWLSKSELAGHFLPAEPFLIKDRSSERQFNFSLIKSHHSAKICKVLEGYTVYLTANIKPQREQMVDIIKCSGGEPLDYTPSVTPGDKVIVITCEEDLNKTSDANAVGVPVCSTELVLGGVLRQEVEIDSHRMMTAGAADMSSQARKRKAKEPPIVSAAKRCRK